jgi:hypothetical protein
MVLSVDSASNRNKDQEIFLGVKGGWCVRLTISPPSVSRLSRENVGALTSHNPCFAYSSILKMRAMCFPETSVNFQCYIPEDISLHNHHCENLKVYMVCA